MSSQACRHRGQTGKWRINRPLAAWSVVGIVLGSEVLGKQQLYSAPLAQKRGFVRSGRCVSGAIEGEGDDLIELFGMGGEHDESIEP